MRPFPCTPFPGKRKLAHRKNLYAVQILCWDFSELTNYMAMRSKPLSGLILTAIDFSTNICAPPSFAAEPTLGMRAYKTCTHLRA
jgi:hypothetical protein